MKNLKKKLGMLVLLMIPMFASYVYAGPKTPVDKHGKLSVQGTQLVDKKGKAVQLYGMSTHGIAWFPQYMNKDAFKSLRDEWNTNCVRIAMYTDEYGGYCSGGNKDSLKKKVFDGIDYATELGMYVIVDWHILNDKNPEKYADEAVLFFDEVSAKYAKNKNVLYEICNEPNSGTSWSDICSYAEKVIPVIRKNDASAVIIVGTPNWCQTIEDAMDFPLSYENVMYAVHFYANSHGEWLRSKVVLAVESGLPVFVSEFGTCNASGDGGFNAGESDVWLNLLDEYNISYMNWALCNKSETAAALKPTCRKKAGWTQDDLSESGKYIYDRYSQKQQ